MSGLKVRIEVTKEVVKELVRQYLCAELGNLSPEVGDIQIETRSEQNYKSTWESADFRVVYEK